MSTHAKMNADYLWVRHAPIEQNLKFKTHGHIFTYDHAPNSVERLEMAYRSIGKTYDWELEKFRFGKKPNDKGNKRRFHRNLFRFIKNPIGYFVWGTARFYMGWRAKILSVIIGVNLFCALTEWKAHSARIESFDRFLLTSGKNVEGMSGRYIGYHNTKPLRGPNMMEGLTKVPIQYHQIVLSDAWKQGIRKELQLTNSKSVVFN